MQKTLSTKFAVVATVASIIFGYAFYRTNGIITGPEIALESPRNGATLPSPAIEIKGKVLRANRVAMNDRPITMSEDGAIREIFLLSYGYNAVKLTAEDRYGRKTEKIVEVVYR